MRLAILIDVFAGGGKERRCLQMIKGLNEHNIKDIHVILIDNVVDYTDLYKYAQIHIIGRKGRFDLNVFYKLYKTLKLIKPDYIMCWSLMKFSFYLCFIKPFIKCKYISAIVTDAMPIKFFSISNIVKYISFKISDIVVGNSYAGLIAYKAPKNKSLVIYNGFDFDRQKKIKEKNDILNELNIKTRYVVSMVARINRHKDYQTFIDAAKKIISYRKDITFLCVGKGELIDFYQNQLSEAEKQYILFTGFRNDTDSILNISNISVLCTNNNIHREGVSNTILESMAYGIPVIATTGGGTNEIVENGKTGFIIPPFSVNALVDKIEILLNNDKLWEYLSNNSKDTVKQKFSLDIMVNKYINLFKSNADCK